MRQLEVPRPFQRSGVDHTHYEIGVGVKVNLDDKVIRVGSDRFMEMCNITIPRQIKSEQCGYSLVYVAMNEQLAGAIELRPVLTPRASGHAPEGSVPKSKKSFGHWVKAEKP